MISENKPETTLSQMEDVKKEYFERIHRVPEVNAIVLTGSAGRGHDDSISDIDSVVVVSTIPEGMTEGKNMHGGVLFDTRIIRERELLSQVWTRDMYYAYLNARILYDPSGNMSALIAAKHIEWQNSVKDKVIMNFVQLSVLIEISDDWKGLKTKTHLEKFIERNDFVSAQMCIGNALDMLFELYFLIKKEVPPDTRNMFRSMQYDNPDDQCLSLFAEAGLVKEYSHVDVERRKSAIVQLLTIMRQRVSDWNVPEDFYNYYLTNRD